MRADSSAGSEAGRSRNRFRTPESYIHWERGLAIVAGMIGVVLLFFLLMIALPIRGREDSGTSTGTAASVAPASSASAPPPARVATAVPPAAGPDQPRVPASAREFPFVRRGPGINFAVIMNLRQGQRVEVVGRSPDRQWLQIVLPERPTERGWVSQDLLTVEGDVNTVTEVRE